MTTITIPRETWDAVLEVLEQSPSIEHSLPNREVCTCSQCDFFRLRKAALSAAKAVSELKLGVAVGELASPEYDQLRAKMQRRMGAKADCLCGRYEFCPDCQPGLFGEVQPTITSSESRDPQASEPQAQVAGLKEKTE